MAPMWPIFSKSKTNSHNVLSSESSKTNHNVLSSESYETVNGSHEYKIKGFSLAKGIGVGIYMSSRRFTVGGHDWVILFNPDGNTQDSQEYISVFLQPVSLKKVRATLEFKLHDQSGKGKYGVHRTVISPITFNGAGTIRSWGFPRYMKRSELETSSYLKDDCFTIHCAVGVVQTRDETMQTRVETVLTRVEEEKPYVIGAPPSNMIQNLKGLLESGIGSDITFHVGNEFFRAHKSILAAQSPVFRAQFFGLTGNPDLDTLAVKQFEPLAFKIMSPIEPIVSEPENIQSALSSLSICETVKVSHEYMIKGYSLTKGMGVGKFMTSQRFTVGSHDWVILFYPDGQNQDNKEYVSVFLNLASPGEVRATFEFKLLDRSGKEKHGVHRNSEIAKTFSIAATKSWGYPQYMKRSEFESSNYLKDDCLIIHCTVGVVKTRDEEGKHYVIPVPPSDMIQNLKGLLESGIGSDITFHVGDEFFRAHKSILAARSPVFRAQFFGLVGNPDIETVAIKQIEPLAFKAMLLFLYSDKLPEAHELYNSESPCTLTTIVQHLLDAVDRFDLPRLKFLCEAKLCEELTANTVATTLAQAEKYQCLQLKTVCLNFAAKPENLEEVMKSDGYASLEKSYPSLLTDLLKTSAVVGKTEV
ncbi:hypothetical protein MKW92_029309 [Papaver armeniacum]|nr:hypothetical protein MKW92_029309 [Papaver armeniacum]